MCYMLNSAKRSWTVLTNTSLLSENFQKWSFRRGWVSVAKPWDGVFYIDSTISTFSDSRIFSKYGIFYIDSKISTFSGPRIFAIMVFSAPTNWKRLFFVSFSKFSKITLNFKQNFWKSPLLAAPKIIVTPKALRRFLAHIKCRRLLVCVTAGMNHKGINMLKMFYFFECGFTCSFDIFC